MATPSADEPQNERRARRIIVTGASAGIGRGIALELARAGHVLGLLARRRSALEATVAEIQAAGGRACAISADLRRSGDAQAGVRGLIELLGGLDALVNNAGIVSRTGFLDMTDSEWRDLVDTNVHGVYHAIRAALPTFLEQSSGHFINISSISGKLPLAPGAGYAATKFAVTGLSQSLFLELRDHGIKVTTIYPGSVGSAASGKVTPEEVGRVCRDVIETRAQNLVSEVEIRPARRPGS